MIARRPGSDDGAGSPNQNREGDRDMGTRVTGSRRRTMLPGALLGLAAMAMAGAGAGTASAGPRGRAASADPQTEAAIMALSGRITTEVKRLPETAPVEQFEAGVLFVTDQSQQPYRLVCAAIQQAQTTPDIAANARRAMANVCRAASRRQGTAAIGAGGAGSGGSAFSTPNISLGGGQSGYTASRQ